MKKYSLLCSFISGAKCQNTFSLCLAWYNGNVFWLFAPDMSNFVLKVLNVILGTLKKSGSFLDKTTVNVLLLEGKFIVQNSNNSWKSFKTMFETYHIYKLMNLKWLLITTYSYHIQSFHTFANKCYHTLAVSSLNCWRERVCECANSSLEREGPLWGPVGPPMGPAPNLTRP